MKVILSYGLGTESTAILLRWLTEPASRWFDLADLIVATAQTGDEFPDTKDLVETHVMPRLQEKGVRFVQLARRGPTEADGWAVLDDTREPRELHIRHGLWKLSDEMRRAGTLPQCQSRRCSIKFKGWVLDHFIADALGGRVRREQSGAKTLNILDVPEPFDHVIGFNADEVGRIERDTTCGGPMRTARYPLMDWGWSRETCLAFIRKLTGVEWRKSCCWMCPFANGNDQVLSRYREFPEVAAQALLLEHVALALNPLTTLYRDRTLRVVIEEDENLDALATFDRLVEECEWAVYRVRRVMTRKGGADRSVEKVIVGTRLDAYLAVYNLGLPIEPDLGLMRAYVSRRQEGVYPTVEEFYVAAPAQADAKAKGTFEGNWKKVSLQLA